jgi:hypothetical protein
MSVGTVEDALWRERLRKKLIAACTRFVDQRRGSAARVSLAISFFAFAQNDPLRAGHSGILWNGLIDLVSAIFALLKLVFEGISAANKYDENQDYYNSIAVEYFDNFLEAIMKIDWVEVAISMLESLTDLISWIGGLPTKLMEALAKVNQTEIAYFLGYVIFQVVEFIFPPLKLAKLGKVAKLEKVIGLFGDLSEKAVKGGKAVGKAVKKGTQNITEVFFELVEGFVRKLNEGTQAYSKWLRDVFEGIRKWLDDALGGYFKTSDEVEALFHGTGKGVDGAVYLSWNKLMKFKGYLESKYRHLNLGVIIVTPNSRSPKLEKLLKAMEKRNAKGAFVPGPPPRIYLLEETSKLTIQHEVWHLDDLEKLGHEGYKKLESWIHDASVWEKTWATRDKWGELELCDSYLYYKKELFLAGQKAIKYPKIEQLLEKYDLKSIDIYETK